MHSQATSLVQAVALVAAAIVATVVLAETTTISNLRKNTYIYGQFLKRSWLFVWNINHI